MASVWAQARDLSFSPFVLSEKERAEDSKRVYPTGTPQTRLLNNSSLCR